MHNFAVRQPNRLATTGINKQYTRSQARHRGKRLPWPES
jgi:hypothetical protein